VQRYGARRPLVIGPIIAAAAFVLLGRPGIGGRYATTFLPGIVVLGLGMAMSVAPLTTTVMGAVGESRAGIASAINNAISRLGGLLAIALLGLVLATVFGRSLDRSLDRLQTPPAMRRQVDAQRPKLAAAEVDDPELQRAIAESFVAGYRAALWTAMGLALVSAACAALLIGRERHGEPPPSR
jgi:MFS family permease